MIDISDKYFIVICGQSVQKTGQSKKLKDIWIFDLINLRWHKIDPINGSIKALYNFSVTLYKNMLYIIGGLV